MKLLRYGPKGQEKPGLLDQNGKIRDLSKVVDDIAGETLSDAGLARIRAIDPATLPEVTGEPRIGPCVARVGKMVCIGLNYADHAAESNLPVPTEPVLFAKWTSAMVGPGQPIVVPPDTLEVDYEAELGVVVGKKCRGVSTEDALNYVAGYVCVNDISARDFQRTDGQWVRAKSQDSFGPFGPFLVTRDELANPQDLGIRCSVNGRTLQNSNTREMIFGVRELIAFISRGITLHPGDLISTGTPPGVGFAQKPPVFLHAGDEVVVEIDGVGRLSNPVKAL